MPPRSHRTSRDAQRERTQARILAAARRLFASAGYDRTTVRAIAREAGSDPGLVIRYFGSKEQLFARAAELPPDDRLEGEPARIAEQMLASLQAKLTSDAAGSVAVLRSMLTHPDAEREVRQALADQQRAGAAALGSPDAALRIGLVGVLVLGVVLGRDLLELDGLRDAPPEQVVALLRPAIHALTYGGAEPGPRGS
ncbi:TetR/AcrR family transcriptional regulator [Pseudonocardia kunmingensis]|uniref:TetR family transcriptional regulator n=1 Tax=Pseudonocardia kunmingensis TaxID=630975 RepID=A0A543DZ20_9PSEU|nr:TetR/AcrR family transcriptional regulator [Pseudonocardia kunmingensis]TQM14580.1 TetR family transcriptional regulator [Pseudonocardia kunmingensis]